MRLSDSPWNLLVSLKKAIIEVYLVYLMSRI